jgi:hypothetical protein
MWYTFQTPDPGVREQTMLFTRHIRIVHSLAAVPNDVPIYSGMSDPVLSDVRREADF